MNSIRNKSILRVLGLALVLGVLFVGGWAGDSFAEMHMQNGHEGDPLDGSDIVGGGSSGSADQDDNLPTSVISLDGRIIHVGEFFVHIRPGIRDGEIVWVLTIEYSRGDLK